MRIIFIFSFICLILFSSCEDNMILRSEKKMKSELQGKWEREFLGDTSIHYREYWTFEGSKLYTTLSVKNPPDLVDNGAVDITLADNVDTVIITGFKVDAKILRAYLKFQLIDKGVDTTVFVDKWEFITLDGGVLYLATDDPNSNTVLQVEFKKVN